MIAWKKQILQQRAAFARHVGGEPPGAEWPPNNFPDMQINNSGVRIECPFLGFRPNILHFFIFYDLGIVE
jgi:hypothetical protein